MKKIYLLLGLMAVVAVPSKGSANLVLDIPPLVAQKDYCKQYSGCSAGPCYPGCNDPCKPCNLTCQNYSSCSSGPCYPECAATDPCKPCAPTPTGGLNDTGITSRAGTSTGQDVDYGRDANPNLQKTGGGLAGFDFTKLNSSGTALLASATSWTCVKDNVTGLTWEVTTSATSNWSNATTYASSFANCGVAAGNWRLPTVKELMNIIAYSKATQSIDTGYFPNTSAGSSFWTVTPISGSSTSAWNIYDGGSIFPMTKGSTLYVRLVSGSQAAENFVGNADGTVTDKNRKLMWKRCSEGQTFSGTGVASCTGTASSNVIWSDALSMTNSSFASYSNWRLPNIKELQTIVKEANAAAPIIDGTLFPNTPASATWSNSPLAGSSTDSWYVDFSNGQVLYGTRGSKTDSVAPVSNVRVRLVRDCTGAECN